MKLETRIETALGMLEDELRKDMLRSTYNFLLQLRYVLEDDLVEEAEPKEEAGKLPEPYTGPDYSKPAPAVVQKIVISCDASIKKNPGGPSSVGVVINFPDKEQPLKIARGVPATTNNQAEYAAVYTGLVTLINLHNDPGFPIEIRSDSQLVINQLREECNVKDPSLKAKRDAILDLVKVVPREIQFVWRPRNSTPELKEANYLAQDFLGVPRH